MVDDIDLKIISDLLKDGRKTLTEIGNKIIKIKFDSQGKIIEEQQGISHVSVKKRLNRLIEDEIIKVVAQVNTKKFDLEFALITLEVESYEIGQRIIRILSKCPRVMFLSTLKEDSYNLTCIIACEDKETLNSYLKSCVIKKEQGITRFEVSLCNIPIVPKFLPLNFGIHLQSRECKNDCEACREFLEEKCVGCPTASCYKNDKLNFFKEIMYRGNDDDF